MAYNPNVPAPDNLVQDDIAAMRDNFRHLDPLAQAVGELQTVSGLAQVVDELQTVSELAQITDDLQVVSALAPYVQALLDSRIVDHNLDVADPPNGWYVRWDNGLQVCYGVRTFENLNCGAQIGTSGWYRNLSADGMVTLPAQFAGINDYVPIPVEGPWVSPYGPTGLGVTHAFTMSAGSFSIYVSRWGSGEIPSVNIGWVAIGRWH